jgi:hypothetical protein
MKGEGPRHERETIINFNDEGDTASLWTASVIVYRRLLKRLGREYLTEDSERHAEFRFPVSFIQLPRPKRRVTEAQREAGRHRRQALFGQERQDNSRVEQSNAFDEGVGLGEP